MPALQKTLSVLHCLTAVRPIPITYIHVGKTTHFELRRSGIARRLTVNWRAAMADNARPTKNTKRSG
jgi:hypothetical protein